MCYCWHYRWDNPLWPQKITHSAEANLWTISQLTTRYISTTVLQIMDCLLYNDTLSHWAMTPAILRLPRRGVGRGLASLVENTGAWPSAKHGGPRAFPPGETQINVRVQEPGVGVLFHQTEDFHLRGFKTAPCGLCYVLLDGHLGVVVNIHLGERT